VPVTADPIEILANEDEVLVVNKPSSIPMHPCGRYRHNSLTYILAKDYDLHNLRREFFDHFIS
jgi:23S rRNA-/tRNA-specific pseudouridylate synthase